MKTKMKTRQKTCCDCGVIFSTTGTRVFRCPECREKVRKAAQNALRIRDYKKPEAVLTAKRFCHTCGKPTYDFECDRCRAKRQAKGW